MDIKLIETGNGGDIVEKGSDLEIIEGFGNMPYLAMFGGNLGQSTPIERLPNEQAFDWWGNSLLLFNDESRQFNSLTEAVLDETVFNSAGRIRVEQAVKKDLALMTDFAEVSVSAIIESEKRIKICIAIQQPDNVQDKDFIFIWDATNNELTTA